MLASTDGGEIYSRSAHKAESSHQLLRLIRLRGFNLLRPKRVIDFISNRFTNKPFLRFYRNELTEFVGIVNRDSNWQFKRKFCKNTN